MPSSPTEILLPNRPSDAPRPAAVTDGEHHSLLVALAAVPDPRDPRGTRYPLVSMLAVAVCAVLAGACTFAAITDWVRDLDRPAWGRLGFTDRVPAATTVWRLLIRIDADVLSAVLTRWLRERATPVVVAGRRWRLVIAIDGKVERGARLPDGRQVHLLSAYDTAAGVVLAQMQIAAKSNEIPAFAPLLDRVATQLGSLDKVLFVADALHAQTDHAEQVAARGGHLMVPVKGNQPTLCSQLKALPWAQVPVGDRRREVGHGRKETRTVKAVTVATPGGQSGSPGPARSRARPPGRRRTWSCYCPPSTPSPPISAHGRGLSGTSRTASTTSGTSRCVKTLTKPRPATAPPCSPRSVTRRSATTAATVRPTSPAPPDAPTTAHTTSSTP